MLPGSRRRLRTSSRSALHVNGCRGTLAYTSRSPIPLCSAQSLSRDRAPSCGPAALRPRSFPSVDAVARFIRAAREEKVPFKCTAGLHHAVRAAHPLTYQPDSPRAVMHGFLNVLLAAAFAQKGASVEELAETLEASSLALPRADLEMRLARECGLVSFGSCSFTEPIAELRSLEIL